MSQNNHRFDWMTVVIIPTAYLAVVLMLDALTPRTTVTPFFGIIGLLVLAFCLTPSAMAFWATVYSVVVVMTFMNHSLSHLLNRDAPAGDDLTPIVRSATFVTGAVLATLFAKVQHRLKRSNVLLTQMLEKLTVPVVSADQDGRIHFANQRAANLAGLPPGELKGLSFFDVFTDKNKQGASIADYLRRFSSSDLERPMVLQCQGRDYLGTCMLMDSTTPQLLMVVLTEPDSREVVPSSL